MRIIDEIVLPIAFASASRERLARMLRITTDDNRISRATVPQLRLTNASGRPSGDRSFDRPRRSAKDHSICRIARANRAYLALGFQIGIPFGSSLANLLGFSVRYHAYDIAYIDTSRSTPIRGIVLRPG